MNPIRIRRHAATFTPDSARVILRPFIPVNPQRITNIIGRALAMSEEETRRNALRMAEGLAHQRSLHQREPRLTTVARRYCQRAARFFRPARDQSPSRDRITIKAARSFPVFFDFKRSPLM